MHELRLLDIQKKYKDKEAVRKFNYTFTNPSKPMYIQTVWGVGYRFNKNLSSGL